MFEELGGFFGWLLVIAFGGTILNYCVKFVNKKWGKKISGNPTGKKIMKLLMTIFVRNHKYWGFLTVLFLLTHFLIQFAKSGINWTGALAAALLILQVGLGIYANVKKKPRKGTWFLMHRTIAVLMILAVAFHILLPYSINSALNNSGSGNTTVEQSSVDTKNLPSFTKEELAKYNGQNGAKAYVAYNGLVYDVSNHPRWKNGSHEGEKAGTDLTADLSKSPHGARVFSEVPVVGTYTN